MSDNSEQPQSCELLGPLGWMLQTGLGVLAFAALIFKRSKEKPKRAWRIWALDNSKQGISALLCHFLNVLLANLMSSSASDDACIWYFITIMFDTTLGMVICFILLQIVEMLLTKYGYLNFKTGNYIVCIILNGENSRSMLGKQQILKNGNQSYNKMSSETELQPQQNILQHQQNELQNQSLEIEPKITFKQIKKKSDDENPENQQNNAQDVKLHENQLINIEVNSNFGSFIKIDYTLWAVQLLIWNFIVLISKSFLYLIQTSLQQPLENSANLLFSSVNHQPTIKLILVMVIIPSILNTFFFWVQDNFLKKSEITTVEEKIGIKNQMFVHEYDNDNFDFKDQNFQEREKELQEQMKIKFIGENNQS